MANVDSYPIVTAEQMKHWTKYKTGLEMDYWYNRENTNVTGIEFPHLQVITPVWTTFFPRSGGSSSYSPYNSRSYYKILWLAEERKWPEDPQPESYDSKQVTAWNDVHDVFPLSFVTNDRQNDYLCVIYGEDSVAVVQYRVAKKYFGFKNNDDLTFQFAGKTFKWQDVQSWLTIKHDSSYYYNRKDTRMYFDFAYTDNNPILRKLTFDHEDYCQFVKGALAVATHIPEVETNGIKKLYDKLAPLAETFKERNVAAWMTFRTFATKSAKSYNAVKISKLFNQYFGEVTTAEELEKLCSAVAGPMWMNLRGSYTSWDSGKFEWVASLDIYKGNRKDILSKQTNRAFSKLMQDMDSLSITPEGNPLLYKAITQDDVPLGIFFRSGKEEQYFLLNDNWELWEEMLAKHYQTTCELAKAASKRTTYEKDLMSYFYFLLYRLPEYLEKHTGCKWTCSPKLITSERELEPPKEGETQTKQRSALTPIVDNAKHHVVVPYASLAIPGRQTLYCYSHSYELISRGFNFKGNTAMSDIEEKLNGRDDYGLMFYTFTGTEQGRGYPTFLIIFERLKRGKTRVHFHRTHPCRSKDGDYNPVNNWIKRTYNWMAGNVRATDIVAQQGDLIFLKTDNSLGETKDVNSYDSHAFSKGPVRFAEAKGSKTDKYLVGQIEVPEDNLLVHPEHVEVPLPKGNYIVRQCRSWEANPVAIWTVNID